MLRIPTWHPDLLRALFGADTLEGRRLRALAEPITRLSSMFNRLDDEAPGVARPYLNDDIALRAYAVYFGTANMLKLHRALREIARIDAAPRRDVLRVLDLGAGTGTGLWGLAAWLRPDRSDPRPVPLDITLVDVSRAALTLADESARWLSANVFDGALHASTRFCDIDRYTDAGSYDLIIVANTLNELSDPGDRLLEICTERLAPGGSVLLLEPALRTASRALLHLRTRAATDGWTIAAPCFRQGVCPALDAEKDWCHADDGWERPAWIEELDRSTGTVKLSLKYSYLVLNRSGATLGGALGATDPQRVVSHAAREKGRTRAYLCGEAGRFPCMQNTRDVSEANRAFARAERYDILELSQLERRTHDCLVPRDSIVTRHDA